MLKTHDLRFTLPVEDLQSEPRVYHLLASEADKAALIKRFNIVNLASLEAKTAVHVESNPDVIWLRGTLKAELSQPCVVTLSEVHESIEEDFELKLVPPDVAEQLDEDEAFADPEAPEYDAFEGETLPLGELIAQTLSVMMNPYPRASDADLASFVKAGITVNEELEQKPSPFSVLAKLSDNS